MTKYIIFLLPCHANVISEYVRAKCLKDFEDEDIKFIYTEYKINKILNKKYLRDLITLVYYLYIVLIKNYYKKIKILYYIKPENDKIIKIIKFLTGIKTVVDINDPIHLFAWIGIKKTISIMDAADIIVFESKEYKSFITNNYKKLNQKSITIEDTPQHEIKINYKNFTKKKQVIWVGSPNTSQPLMNVKGILKKFEIKNYKIILLGCDNDIFKILKSDITHIKNIEKYNTEEMQKYLIESEISIVPMEDNELYNLRGNLKVKISMSFGCVVLAQYNDMHARIINNKIDGHLIENFDNIDINDYINTISNKIIGYNAYLKIKKEYSRKKHAQKIKALI